MSFSATPPFMCPICHSPLFVGDKVWHCQPKPLIESQKSDGFKSHGFKSHSFDVAKQGYVNLLPVQFKKSKNPGDSEPAILARQRFLQQGFYAALAQGLLHFAKQQLPLSQNATNKATTWLDIGCGEGYYTEQFLTLNPNTLIALDISKPAVLATAKRLKNQANSNVYCVVASASQVPLPDNSVDVISSIFSPILPDEFGRLLTAGGVVLIAKPLPHHLLELREGLFETVIDHDSDKFIEQMAENFDLTATQDVQGQICVTPDALADLLTMTPYAYRASPKKRHALLDQCQQTGQMNLKVAFVLYWFSKK